MTEPLKKGYDDISNQMAKQVDNRATDPLVDPVSFNGSPSFDRLRTGSIAPLLLALPDDH